MAARLIAEVAADLLDDVAPLYPPFIFLIPTCRHQSIVIILSYENHICSRAAISHLSNQVASVRAVLVVDDLTFLPSGIPKARCTSEHTADELTRHDRVQAVLRS